MDEYVRSGPHRARMFIFLLVFPQRVWKGDLSGDKGMEAWSTLVWVGRVAAVDALLGRCVRPVLCLSAIGGRRSEIRQTYDDGTDGTVSAELLHQIDQIKEDFGLSAVSESEDADISDGVAITQQQTGTVPAYEKSMSRGGFGVTATTESQDPSQGLSRGPTTRSYPAIQRHEPLIDSHIYQAAATGSLAHLHPIARTPGFFFPAVVKKKRKTGKKGNRGQDRERNVG
ncbi:hypothetical protein H4582DRAFT_2052613 [Lactarius indigo]|nr:hypothetical protein H4582DRAFT_2052613 [Lactarius indigo]